MLKRFFGYYQPYRRLFISDFGCAVFTGLLELAFSVAVNQVVDKIMPKGDFRLIALASVDLFASYVINAFLQFIVVYFGRMLGMNTETDIREELYQHLQAQPLEYYDNQKTGKLMSRLVTDLFEISEVAHHGPEGVFTTIMTLAGPFLLMLAIHVKLAVATFILSPFITTALGYFNKEMAKANTDIYDNLGEFDAGIETSVSGIHVTQSFANEPFGRKQFNYLSQMYRKSKLYFYKVMGISSAYDYLLIRLINSFSLVFGAYYTIKGEITEGQFVGLILLANIFIRPVERINNMIENYLKGFAGSKRFTEEMDKQPSIEDLPGAVAVSHLEGTIAYKNVSFAYKDGIKALDHINLKVQPGETVAFVGQSGSGKTVLYNLLPRFYEVSNGEITINDRNIQQMTLASLRKQVGIVQQDVFLFPGTLRENVAYGNLNATEIDTQQVVKLAHLEHVTQLMPDGLDIVTGEHGVKLSGGQKQRVAVARMFLKSPPILILDEATSALDTETEQVVQESLNSLANGRTTLIIAHRLTMIKHANRIIVVSDQGILEGGTHEILYAQRGHYRRLYDTQSRT